VISCIKVELKTIVLETYYVSSIRIEPDKRDITVSETVVINSTLMQLTA
jgi:hypothetical protein